MILLVATTNAGKLREIQALLAGLAVDVRALPADTDIPAPEETGVTFAENARLKARYYAEATGLLTVAEDSGLEIDALDGRPGVLSARYPSATYDERFHNLYAELAARETAPSSWTARFVCALALARGGGRGERRDDAAGVATSPGTTGTILFEARGTVEGLIAPEPRGAHGFGYDPIFFYPPYGRTLAETTDEEKSRVSHRGAAFRELRAFLESPAGLANAR
jgi:XTP/dITP diphosphohydrolase